ncbi:MAG: LptF/LptG family permease [Balneolaceae bacterium]|nr:LptF/LptG family permease [Balneolaceae bacterium]
MIKKLDKYIFLRLLTITLFVLAVLIFIFVVIHFSDHSEDFTDNGAQLAEIFGVYYLNYIPEIIRLVTPVAIFIACLYLTGQMAERLEITALKAAGISLYRLMAPYLAFGILAMGIISYLDGFVVPKTNAKRFAFENKYLNKSSDDIDNRKLYRQESANTLMKVNYFDANENRGFRVELIHFSGDSIKQTTSIEQMHWLEESQQWRLLDLERRTFTSKGFIDTHADTTDTTLNVLPRDLARTTSDIYQLTYPKAYNYIQSIERSGAGSVGTPKVQFYGRLVYPLSIIVVSIVGFALASVRRRGGKGFYIAAGLGISFLYLVFMKIIEPFGGEGVLTPLMAVSIPHLFFFVVGVILLLNARK